MPTPRTDRFWSRLVWPLLWPLLVAQLALALLCLVAALLLAFSSPGWGAAVWPLVALLLGSLGIAGALVVRLRQRLGDDWARLEDGLGRVERETEALLARLPAWLSPAATTSFEAAEAVPEARLAAVSVALAELRAHWARLPSAETLLEGADTPGLLLHNGRIVALNRQAEQLLGMSAGGLCGQPPDACLRQSAGSPGGGARPVAAVRNAQGEWQPCLLSRLTVAEHELLLLDTARTQSRELDELTTARDQAREASRLKSHYLALLHRELSGLVEQLAAWRSIATPTEVAALQERAAELQLLLDSLAEVPADTGSAPLASALRVLIVDDGPVNRRLVSEVLERHGVAVDSAASGQEALARGARQAYDVVFMDIVMPDMDGVETARRWRDQEQRRGALRPSVLVALTANASPSDRQRFHAAGMDDHLAKPYRPRALLALLSRWHPLAFTESLLP